MDGSLVPLLSAGIGGLVAILVMLINQFFSHIRWKEELSRKGEDKYLEKRLHILHESSLEFYRLSQEVLIYAEMDSPSRYEGFKEDVASLRLEIRKAFNNTTPYVKRQENTVAMDAFAALESVDVYTKELNEKNEDELFIKNQLLKLCDLLFNYKLNLEELMKTGNISPRKNALPWICLISSMILNLFLGILITFN